MADKNKEEVSVEIKEQKKNYKKLLEDPDFENLEIELQKPNIFSILGISRMEIRHSNFLAWLLDPNASHGLGNRFLIRILWDLATNENNSNLIEEENKLDIIEINQLNFSNVEVNREVPLSVNKKDGAIDILINFRDENDKLVICIENKIDAPDSKEQLASYSKWVKDTFEGNKIVFIYLTPMGIEPNDKDEAKEWINYSYREGIIEHLKSLQDSITDSIVKTYISDYLTILKSEIMNTNESATDLANAIYDRHSSLIDFIVKNRESNIKYKKKWEKDNNKRVYDFANDFIKLIREANPDSEYELGFTQNAITVKRKTNEQNRYYNIYSLYPRTSSKTDCNLDFTFSTKEDQENIKKVVKEIVDNKKKEDNDKIYYTDKTYFTVYYVNHLSDCELKEIHMKRFNIDQPKDKINNQ